jgi:CheY-like chemotaxis protein
VLVVDDDEELRSSASELLTNAGYFVTEADDGDVALELLAHSCFDVVILDLRMPRLDGFEVLARLEAGPPVAVVTGEYLGPDELARLGEQPVAVLQKPVPPGALLDALSRIVESTRPDRVSRLRST